MKFETEDLEHIKEILLLSQIAIPLIIALLPTEDKRFAVILICLMLISWGLRSRVKKTIRKGYILSNKLASEVKT